MKLAGMGGPSPNISVTTITAISQDQRSPVTAPFLVTDGAYRPNLGPLNGAAPFFVSEFEEGDGGTARLVQVLEENS
jgi:hypothetical protein